MARRWPNDETAFGGSTVNRGTKHGNNTLRTILDIFWAADAAISTAVFEVWTFIRRVWAAYSAWLERFRVTGIRRLIVDVLDDSATLGTIFAFVVVAYMLPPFAGKGDVWNARRQLAVTITDPNGEIIGRRGVRQDDTIPLEELSPYLVKAVLATEDARFYEHFGVDAIGTLRAAIANARAQGVVQGGSTLTQQLAKNLFLSPERSFRRKVHEAFLALWIEAHLSKDEILKMYLDRSYLGSGNYGVEAAAQYYFGKSARDLSLKEAAMIAGLFKAPSKYSPAINPDAAEKRANVVLLRMLDAGFISYGELLAAQNQKVTIVGGQEDSAPQHFLDLVYRETQDILKRKGLTGEFVVEVRSTIDMRMQKLAQKAIAEALEKYGKTYRASQGALVALTPTGAIRAIVGGRDYESSQFNRATDAWRQPGSSFKPFVYLTALLNGMTPNSIVLDAPVTIRGWTPQNYSRRYHGRIPLITAITHSYNSVPVRLMLKFGAKEIIRTARRAGLDAPLKAVPSLPLGANEVTVLDITGAYAAFANGGYRVQPYSVLEIRRPDGTLLYAHKDDPDARPVRAFPEEKIAQLDRMMANVVLNGTARRANLGFTPQAGKTGTTSSYRDAWFIGFTGHLVTGVWFGNDDYTPTQRMTGGSLPAMTWKAFMEPALAGMEPKPLPGVPLTREQRQVAAKARAARKRNTLLARPADGEWKDEGETSISLAMLPPVSEIADSDILTAGAATAAVGAAAASQAKGRKNVSAGRAGTVDAGTRGKRTSRRDGNEVVRTLRNVFTIFKPAKRQRIFRTRSGNRVRTNINTRRRAVSKQRRQKKDFRFLKIFR